MTLEEFIQLVKDYLIDTWKLDKFLAERMAWLYYWSRYYGIGYTVTSGFRDPARQAELRARWDRGDRTGLKARPAKTSKHSTKSWGKPAAQAVDIKGPDLDTLGYWAVKYLGLKWGGNFRSPDPIHFYVA